MKSLKLGLIPAPDLPADLTSKIVDDLPSFLSDTVDDSVSWKPEIIVDPLVGSAEYMNELLDKVVKLKKKNNWDLVVCLTDLPQFTGKHVIAMDIHHTEAVSLLSIPAFGVFPLKRRVKKAIYYVVQDMYEEYYNPEKQADDNRRKQSSQKNIHSVFSPLHKINFQYKTEGQRDEEQQEVEQEREENTNDSSNDNNQDETTQESTKRKVSIRYIIQSRLIGYFRLLTGMTFANRPWTALKSFKKILVIAFGTGIYITIFPTPWELSTVYSIPRFISLMFIAMIGMITWIIIAHNLWEKPSHKGDYRLRRVYNYTTVITLGVIAIIHYAVLYIVFLGGISLFVPPGLFEASADIKESIAPQYYLLLAWLSTSLGILAGSIGTTGEDEETIRQITYSYRQMNRYYEIQNKSDEKEHTENDKNNVSRKASRRQQMSNKQGGESS